MLTTHPHLAPRLKSIYLYFPSWPLWALLGVNVTLCVRELHKARFMTFSIFSMKLHITHTQNCQRFEMRVITLMPCEMRPSLKH